MWPCRTRPSTSPMGTSTSSSGPRSSPAETSPQRSPSALKRYVSVQEGLAEGFDDVVVRVGIGTGRKVRFTGVLVGEWVDSSTKRADHYRVWRGRTGKFVVHVERSPSGGPSMPRASRPAGAAGSASATSATAAPRRSRPSTSSTPSTSSARRSRPSCSTWSRAPRASRRWRSSTSDPRRPAVPSARRQRGRRAMTTRSTTTSAIEVRGLRKSFGKQLVLDGIDLDVARRHGLRAARPERRRQDDGGPHPHDADLGRRRRGPHRRLRRRARAGRGPAA